MLRHTDECMAYAAKTGRPFCIAPCADERRELGRSRFYVLALSIGDNCNQMIREIECSPEGLGEIKYTLVMRYRERWGLPNAVPVQIFTYGPYKCVGG